MNTLALLSSFIALVLLEIILGLDNLIFLSLLVDKLPKQKRSRARRIGLTLAWITRLLLLSSAVLIVHLTHPLWVIGSWSFSLRDLFLFIGGLFLIGKATQEIHDEVEATEASHPSEKREAKLRTIVIQIALMDIIFSFDSVLTAVGLTSNVWVMFIAMTFAIVVMLYASAPIGGLIEKHPTIKMLALSFLILIGTLLLADAFSFHVPRGYLYFAMGFALGVESLNILKQSRRQR